MFFIIDGHDAVFDGNSFAWEGNDTFDNVLIGDIRWDRAGSRILDSLGFVIFNSFFVFVHKDNDLAAFWDVFVTDKMRPRYGSAINNNAVIVVESIFHADSDNIIGTINVGV